MPYKHLCMSAKNVFTIFDADEKMWLLLKLYRELVINREPHVITS